MSQESPSIAHVEANGGLQESPNIVEESAAALISRIEDIIEDVIDSLQENRPLSISIRSRRTGRESAVVFPTTSNSGARRFTAYLTVLYHCHGALTSGVAITKRFVYFLEMGVDMSLYMFYLNKDLFERQSYVDQIIDDIAFTLGVNRDALNIVATSKGLVAGGPFSRGSGELYVGVPGANSLTNLELHGIQWVLVIEKEATFRSLVAARYFDHSAAGPGLLVTAKGYPDLATRQFLHVIHSRHPFIPLHALVDFDPDGIGIMRTYKLGSQALRHEENVTAPGILWLGVKSCDIFCPKTISRLPHSPTTPLQGDVLSVPISSTGSAVSQNPSDGLSAPDQTVTSSFGHARLPTQLTDVDYKTNALAPSDRRKASNLLRIVEESAPLEAEEMSLLRELQVMLMLNVKFEIQAISGDGNMTSWLDERLLPGLM